VTVENSSSSERIPVVGLGNAVRQAGRRSVPCCGGDELRKYASSSSPARSTSARPRASGLKESEETRAR